MPTVVRPEDGLKVSAKGEGQLAIVRMILRVDGQLIYAVNEHSLRHNIDTRALAPGKHRLTVEALDEAGHIGQAELAFEILVPTVQPTPAATTSPAPAPLPSSTSTPAPSPQAIATAKPTNTPPQIVPVSISNGELTISTYAYEQALYTDTAKAGHPYPLLDRSRVGAARPKAYPVLYMRNEYLELTLMPTLGGRIYQCRFLPTRQPLFYNNPVIKPTHWGPPDQGWWLAAGGMEFCLPVDEHGYVTAEPWNAEVARHADGSATVTMSIQERSRNILARVAITLRPQEAGFHVRTTLQNPDAQPKPLQFWLNAMLAPGSPSIKPSLRFYYPTSEVIVHSRGDTTLPDAYAPMPWPIYNGRDLGLYANWQNWLGFFAPALRQPFTAIYDDTTQLGMVRAFPADVARGAKLFGFGRDFGDTGAYTDDGSQYIEMWGGLTPTFADYATLAARATLTWEETWYVISRCGGPSAATARAALSAKRDGEHLDLVVASPAEYQCILSIAQGAREVMRQAFTVRPDAPFRAQVSLDPKLEASIRITDSRGNLVLAYTI